MNVQHGIYILKSRLLYQVYKPPLTWWKSSRAKAGNASGPQGKRQHLATMLHCTATVSEHHLQPTASHLERSKVTGHRVQTWTCVRYFWCFLSGAYFNATSRLYDYIISVLPEITKFYPSCCTVAHEKMFFKVPFAMHSCRGIVKFRILIPLFSGREAIRVHATLIRCLSFASGVGCVAIWNRIIPDIPPTGEAGHRTVNFLHSGSSAPGVLCISWACEIALESASIL